MRNIATFLKLVIDIIGREAYEASKKEIVDYLMFVSKSQSKNAKTGVLTQTYSSKNTCPVKNCPFKACGCYARAGHCKIWFNVASGGTYNKKVYAIRIKELADKLKEIKTTRTIRHNVAGDICRINSDDINPALIAELMEQYDGHNVYTYTHCKKTPENLKLIRAACDCGFRINASCEKLEDVERARAHGVAAVLAVESMPEETTIINGVKYCRCPAVGGDVQCNKCMRCYNTERDYVVVFPLHGTKVNIERVKKAGFLIKELK